MKQGIYSTGGHSNKQEKERGRQGGQVYTKEAEHIYRRRAVNENEGTDI